jgi:hypothetical protein
MAPASFLCENHPQPVKLMNTVEILERPAEPFEAAIKKDQIVVTV